MPKKSRSMVHIAHSQTLQCKPVLDSTTCLLSHSQVFGSGLRVAHLRSLAISALPETSALVPLAEDSPVHFNLYLRRQTQLSTEDKDILSPLCALVLPHEYVGMMGPGLLPISSPGGGHSSTQRSRSTAN